MFEELKKLADKVERCRWGYSNEQKAIKYALVLPFLQILGYNVFSPDDVEPGYSANDESDASGAMVDYALRPDDKVQLLVVTADRSLWNSVSPPDSLKRVFAASDARIGIYSNGLRYHFYTDLEERGQMDNEPYLVFDLQKIGDQKVRDEVLVELRRLSKTHFNMEEIWQAAFDLKFHKQIYRYLKNQLEDPDRKFIQFIYKQVYNKPLSQSEQVRFREIVREVTRQFGQQQEEEEMGFLPKEIGGRHDFVSKQEKQESQREPLYQQEADRSIPDWEQRPAEKQQSLDRESSSSESREKKEPKEERPREKEPQAIQPPSENGPQNKDETVEEKKERVENIKGQDILDKNRIKKQRELTGTDQDLNGENTEKDSEEEVHVIEGQGKSKKDGGYEILNDIISDVTDPDRIRIRDKDGYLEVLINDDINKCIARLHYKDDPLVLGLFDAYHEEYQIPMKRLNDIYQFSDQIKVAAEEF